MELDRTDLLAALRKQAVDAAAGTASTTVTVASRASQDAEWTLVFDDQKPVRLEEYVHPSGESVSGRVKGGVLNALLKAVGCDDDAIKELNLERSRLGKQAASARQAEASGAPRSEAPRQPPKRTRASPAKQSKEQAPAASLLPRPKQKKPKAP